MGSATNKLMTTRFPPSAVLMEMAAFSEGKLHQDVGLVGAQDSQPRNRCTSKGVTDGFGPKLECVIKPSELQWCFLPGALAMGRSAELEFRDFMTSGVDPQRGRRQKRRRRRRARFRGMDNIGHQLSRHFSRRWTSHLTGAKRYAEACGICDSFFFSRNDTVLCVVRCGMIGFMW